MNRLLYFDCQNGISGDMTLGALIDAGVSIEDLRRELQKLPVQGWRLEAEAVKRAGVAGTQARVVIDEAEHHPHRHYSHIRDMLESVELPGRAAERARQAFRVLGEAEATVHDSTLEKVHFHEVGAVDAIIDIVGAMIGFELLGADQFACSFVVVGSGEVKCSHGVMPVPAPATALLLKDCPIEAGPVAKEMTTPTGAAILRALAPSFGPLPMMKLETVAYGSGERVIEGRTNMLRMLVGETGSPVRSAPLETARLCLLSTEIDDMNPEWYGPLLERLFDAGCRDAVLQPIVMKKGRPGVSVRVLTDEERRGDMLEILLRHTTTFGVKAQTVDRYCLPRRRESVETPYGSVRVKLGFWGEEVLQVAPEFEDCRRCAEETDTPLSRVYEAARAAAAQTTLEESDD